MIEEMPIEDFRQRVAEAEEEELAADKAVESASSEISRAPRQKWLTICRENTRQLRIQFENCQKVQN
jgi:hypothetical protein